MCIRDSVVSVVAVIVAVLLLLVVEELSVADVLLLSSFSSLMFLHVVFIIPDIILQDGPDLFRNEISNY